MRDAMSNMKIIRGGRLMDIAAHGSTNVDLLIDGDTVREIGQPGMVAPDDALTIDATGKLLHPGLVNAHTHGHGALAKGMGDRWTLELLLASGPWTYGKRIHEDKYLATKIAAVEMVLKGCTACYDLTLEIPMPTVAGLESIGRAYQDIGMRAVVAPMVADATLYEAIPGLMEALTPGMRKDVEKLRLAPYETSLANMKSALHGWSFDRERIRMAVAPTIPLHCSDAFMIGCAKLAREYGVGLHSHVAESKVQAISGIKRYGKSLTAHLDEIGLLGPDFTVAHGVWLDDDDCRRLGDHGSSVAHNPASNMLLGSGIANARAMLDHKVNLGIGTDGANCSDNQNMYEAMHIASMVSNVRSPDSERWLSTREVVEAATIGSARALGFEKIGRIAPGYKADIVFLDLAAINWIPFNDSTNQLVHTEDGTSVHSVMIGGRMIVENRHLLSVDMARFAAEVETARARLAEANQPGKELFERLETVVGTFCPALARVPHHIHRYASSDWM